MRLIRSALVAASALILPLCLSGQIIEVNRNVNLRLDPSSTQAPIRRLEPPERAALLDTIRINGYLRVRTAGGLEGFVWSRNVTVLPDVGWDVGPPTFAAYDRDDWRYWVDADGDCEDARQEALIRDADGPITFETTEECRVESSTWIDPFGGATFTDPSDLDIDHMVPLKNASDAGGWRWDADKKKEYANDLSEAMHLLAVEDGLNQSKGSRGPEEWLPPDSAFHCAYVRAWQEIKARWELTMTTAELLKVREILEGCGPP